MELSQPTAGSELRQASASAEKAAIISVHARHAWRDSGAEIAIFCLRHLSVAAGAALHGIGTSRSGKKNRGGSPLAACVGARLGSALSRPMHLRSRSEQSASGSVDKRTSSLAVERQTETCDDGQQSPTNSYL